MENIDKKADEKRRDMEDRAFDEMRREGEVKKEERLKKAEERQPDTEIAGSKSSRLWLWLGVIVLIFILIYWLFAIGTFGDLQDWFNG